MNEKHDTTESLIGEFLAAVFVPVGDGPALFVRQDEVLALVQRLRSHCYRLGQHATTALSSHAGEQRWFRDLLAVVHRDGGHHTEKVGTEQSAVEATRIVSGLLRTIDELHIQLSAARDEVAELRAEATRNP